MQALIYIYTFVFYNTNLINNTMKKILGILTITLVLAACDKEQKLTENLELTKNSNEFIINDSTIEKNRRIPQRKPIQSI